MTNASDDHRRDRRVKIATAALGGILAGAARAVVDWLLRCLTTTY